MLSFSSILFKFDNTVQLSDFTLPLDVKSYCQKIATFARFTSTLYLTRVSFRISYKQLQSCKIFFISEIELPP
jgi:hypothetical protein